MQKLHTLASMLQLILGMFDFSQNEFETLVDVNAATGNKHLVDVNTATGNKHLLDVTADRGNKHLVVVNATTGNKRLVNVCAAQCCHRK